MDIRGPNTLAGHPGLGTALPVPKWHRAHPPIDLPNVGDYYHQDYYHQYYAPVNADDDDGCLVVRCPQECGRMVT
jgi:hypothetical protein